jgi:hypothetical protein
VSQIDQFRRELLERLLEVHVAFIVHYWEINRADLATRHVTIIGRSRIPPAVKKRLVGKVFDEVTARFRQVGDQQAADAVLAMTERFLRLFPDHLPALRQYTEAATRCVEQMSSYQRDWQQIVQFADRTTPSLRALSQHPELASDPLAVDVLVRLATELTLRGRDRSDSLLGDDFHAVAHSKRCEAKGALTSAIEWGRLAAPHALPDSVLLRLLANVLNSKALCTFVDCQDALDSDRSDRVRLEEARNLIHGAVSLSQEALALAPDDDTLAKNLEFLLENREKLDEP